MPILYHRKSKQERKSFLNKVINRQIQTYIKNGSINGLDLCDTPITKLPNNLTKVGGFLNLYESNIKELPDNLTVDGSLYITDNNYISELPKSLIVNGHFYCGNTPLSKKYTKEEIKQLYPNIKGNVCFY